jgi:hypothetical protein
MFKLIQALFYIAGALLFSAQVASLVELASEHSM